MDSTASQVADLAVVNFLTSVVAAELDQPKEIGLLEEPALLQRAAAVAQPAVAQPAAAVAQPAAAATAAAAAVPIVVAASVAVAAAPVAVATDLAALAATAAAAELFLYDAKHKHPMCGGHASH